MPATKKKETYSEAMARLEKIVSQIDNNELEIDVLAEKIKEANGIIAASAGVSITEADKILSKKAEISGKSKEELARMLVSSMAQENK